MILLTLAFAGFGIADLVRWSEEVKTGRAVLAFFAGTASIVAIALLAGMSPAAAALIGLAGAVALLPWICRGLPAFQIPAGAMLGLILAVVAIAFCLGSLVDPIAGPLASWYSHLGFAFTVHTGVDQFMAGVAGALFLIASANRIVRLTLEAAKASLPDDVKGPRGGRILGPIERLIVAAAVVTGDLTGAGFVIAAKGLLRFPELRDSKPQIDRVTEYLLLGTLTSVMIAAIVAILVLINS